jgi:type IV secretory pathway VirB2 component (pilin)
LGAKVVVAAHPTDSIVTEDAMTIAIMLSVAGLGFLCWLAFNLAVHALPFFAAVAGGLFAYHTGAGPIGGAAIAIAAGATTLVAGQFAFAHSRSMILRSMMLPHVRTRRLLAAFCALVGALLRAIPAYAAGSNMPWEQPLQQILTSIEGPVSKIVAVIIIIVTGLTLAFGDTAGGFRRLIQIVFGLSIAFAASSFFLSFFSFGGGALI